MPPQHITVAIVGAGQAGLAMSRELSLRGIDHVVLEKGVVGQAWRFDRWDSLRLLTPNWANGLPGVPYRGGSENGFMTAAAFADSLKDYRKEIAAPVIEGIGVGSVQQSDAGFLLETTHGQIACRRLVAASGGAAKPIIPALAGKLPPQLFSTNPGLYKRPSDLPKGGVLVVGASASGVQLARELQLSGRPVTLSVGGHLRFPRRYRGRDIECWVEAIGALDESFDQVDDIARARRSPSPQLIGGPDAVDLPALTNLGIEIVGRLMDIRAGKALFSGGLANVCRAADLKQARLLNRIDAWIEENSPNTAPPVEERPERTLVPQRPRLEIDLTSGEISSVVWACGFRPGIDWLSELPVFDARGRFTHHGGVVVGAPGLYAMGLPFMRRRRSAQISGVGPDAQALAQHLEASLHRRSAA